MKEKVVALHKTANVAGWLYLAVILVTVYAHVYVPLQIFVKGDAVATAKNILANEFLFRSCIVVSLSGALTFLILSLNLSRLLKEVNRQLASLMVALVAVQVPVAFVLAACKLTALMVLKSDSPNAFSDDQIPGVAMLFLEITRYGYTTLALFGGLWLIPFGLLVYKSRFIPRIFGILLITTGTAYTGGSLISMLFPAFSQPQVLPFIFFVTGEISMMLWFLIKGVRDYVSIEVFSETKRTIRSSPAIIKEHSE